MSEKRAITVCRVQGIETEYGIFSPEAPGSDSAKLSAQIIHSYSAAAVKMGQSGGVRWDYSGEQPLRDARGFELSREEADPSMLTDNPQQLAPSGPAKSEAGGQRGLGNQLSHTKTLPRQGKKVVQRKVIPTEVVRLTKLEEKFQRGNNTALANGGRLYLDHSHPEYSAPETTSPRAAVIYDRAGELIMARAATYYGTTRSITKETENPDEILLYKNNVDGKGASYGTHENYLVSRKVEFEDLITVLTPFLVTRPIICGSGRVGIGPASEKPGFQICQRADYVQQHIGLETTFNRPIINTRDEPHADPDRWRRLHVIGGDANVSSISTWIKLGTTSAILWVLENVGLPAQWAELALADPVGECALTSHDLSLTRRLLLVDGRQLTALEIQRCYLKVCVEQAQLARAEGLKIDEETAALLTEWEQLLTGLENDPASCADRVEWVAKYQLFEAMRMRRKIGWDNPLLAAMDLQWSDMRPGKSLAAKLEAVGRLRTVGTSEEVAASEFNPPENTRAWFRGELIRRFPGEVFAGGWHSVVVDAGGEYLNRLPLTDPFEWTRAHVEELLAGASNIKDVVQAVTLPTRTPAGVRYGNLWY